MCKYSKWIDTGCVCVCVCVCCVWVCGGHRHACPLSVSSVAPCGFPTDCLKVSEDTFTSSGGLYVQGPHALISHGGCMWLTDPNESLKVFQFVELFQLMVY